MLTPTHLGIYKALELWYEWLKRTNRRDWSSEVKEDFHDVFEMDRLEWVLNTRSDLLVDPENDYVVKKLDEGKSWDGTGNTIALILNLNHSRAKLLKVIEGWIDRSTTKPKRGRPSKRERKAKYDFAHNVDTTALEITLFIHDLRRDNPKMPLWQLIDKTQEEHTILARQKLKKSDPDATAKKRVMAVTASRYLARAERIKAGVCRGVFPAL